MLQKSLQPIRLNRVGSFFNFPNWRYLVYLEPERANLGYCRVVPKAGSGALVRYVQSHHELLDSSTVVFSFTSFFSKALQQLSLSQRDMLFSLFNKRLRAQGDKKLYVPSPASEHVRTWNLKYVSLVSDAPLREFLYHVTNAKYSKDFAFALKLKDSTEHQKLFCALGYHIFAGLSDVTIAHRFKLFPSQIRALRLLFFDFSNAPTNPVARAAYFNQLADNRMISDVDRRYYKVIGSLGELGLKAEADPSSLTFEEKEKLQSYLADSMIENVTSLLFSIEDKQDALAYNGVINNLAGFFIKKEEVKYFRAKIENLDANTTRIRNERTNYNSILGDDDLKAMEAIQQYALRDNPPPPYKTITELKSEN